MQNAQDANATEITITFEDRTVAFSHNGLPFSEEDITHLIFHGSSKPELIGKRGKFGTGFMTTHLLSKRVNIKGDMEDGRSFDFELTREANSDPEMAISLNASWDNFKTSIRPEKRFEITTFTYLDLEPVAITTVENVLKSLPHLMPYVLVFSGQINRVTVRLNLVPDGPLMREKPTLILLHGGPGYDHASFKPAFSRLSDIVQIVYYDHRGHGRSDSHPINELTLDTLADDIVRLCNTLGIIKPIVLGQSFGGFVAQRYIDRHPAHPLKVILSSTSPSFRLDKKLAMFEKLGGVEARNAAKKFWTVPTEMSYNVYQKVCRPFYATATPTNNHGTLRSTFNGEILFKWIDGEYQNMNLLHGLARAQCPVLVLAGKLDPVCPIDSSRDIVAALPEQFVQFEEFSDCGHGVWRDDPDKAFLILRQFILEN
jgi:proline iminopeptidase